jgi:hypothetical protein
VRGVVPLLFLLGLMRQVNIACERVDPR